MPMTRDLDEGGPLLSGSRKGRGIHFHKRGRVLLKVQRCFSDG